jgi:tetratricopeptide (TPR) repeat protein
LNGGLIGRLTRRVRRVAGRSTFQVGRLLERTVRRPRLVEPVYRFAHRLLPNSAPVLARLGRVRERRQNWLGAEQAYTAAIELKPPNVETYLGRRARVLERLGRWKDALADCNAAPDEELPERLVRRIAEELGRTGKLTDAISFLARPLASEPTVKYFVVAAECHADLGDLTAARSALRSAVDLAPENLNIRTNLGRTAARASLVPFTLVEDKPELVAEGVHHAAFDQAVAQLEHVVKTAETRVWAAYWLGHVYEFHSQYTAAAAAYQVAVNRAHLVDKPWAHHAERAWRFRWDYAKQRLADQPADDTRLDRSVRCGPPEEDVSGAAGYFEVSVTNNGLLVEGFVLHDRKGSVELCVDDRPIMSTAGNLAAWHRDFKVTIVHNVLDEFPVTSRLSLRVGANPLVTVGAARFVDIVVPDGRGRLGDMLAGRRTITKKGRWSDAILTIGSRDDVLLAAYTKARAFFEEQLGINLFLSYGTLLGCYRDGRLIPGDDDFDVSYVSDAPNPEDFKKEGQDIIRALLRGGFDARVAIDGRMFHLRVGDVVLDVNPFWFYNGRAWSFAAHDLGRDVFDPPATMVVDGVEVYIPGKAELFLAENYGLDWRTPRSDFHYHRAKRDRTVLRSVLLVPSEVRALVEYSERLRAHDPSAGRFHGYGDPAKPQFD